MSALGVTLVYAYLCLIRRVPFSPLLYANDLRHFAFAFALALIIRVTLIPLLDYIERALLSGRIRYRKHQSTTQE